MTSSIHAIELRKRALTATSDAQRNDLTRIYYGWHARTSVARQVAGILKNPFVVAGIGLVMLKLPWRRAFRMSGLAWRTWRFLMLLRRIIT